MNGPETSQVEYVVDDRIEITAANDREAAALADQLVALLAKQPGVTAAFHGGVVRIGRAGPAQEPGGGEVAS